jgi:signal transduction histidine kinase
MSTGKPYEIEERGYYINGYYANCLTRKVALFDALGKVIRLLGVSFDITQRKQKEELERKLEMQKEIYTIAKEVAHDINSPLTSMKMVEYMSRDRLADKEKKMLELSITSIEAMARKLTEKYKVAKEAELGNVSVVAGRIEEMVIAPYLGISEVLNRHEYISNKNYNINYYPDEKNKIVFIKGDYSDFCRMMSNIINNGVEAVEGKKAEIKVGYEVKGEEVEIRVKDNGKGMSKEMVEKIVKGQEIGTTKKGGHGIGTQQIMGTIKAMRGKIKIESKEGVETEVILTFSECEKPRWFADKIEIKKGDTVVIVNDEESVHMIWKEKLRLYEKDITVVYFTKGLEAIEYISSLKDKRKGLLITKYELKGQEVNGIEVIEKSDMKDRHVLVTGLHLSKIRDFSEKRSYLKILYKNLLNDISVSLVG